MAKAFSPMFLGKQIDGIWHTGIVVYGKEYYFGGGICAGIPKQTPYGYPVQVFFKFNDRSLSMERLRSPKISLKVS